jgi:hypothetical protein
MEHTQMLPDGDGNGSNDDQSLKNKIQRRKNVTSQSCKEQKGRERRDQEEKECIRFGDP